MVGRNQRLLLRWFWLTRDMAKGALLGPMKSKKAVGKIAAGDCNQALFNQALPVAKRGIDDAG